MGFRDSIAFIKKLWILLFLSLLITPNKSIAQPATLKLDRIWALDIQGNVTALRLADSDGDKRNEIFVGLWDGDSGYVEVFSGFNGIFIQRSEKIPAHKVIDLDIGDIDGDQNLEVVIGADTTHVNRYNSLICVLDAEGLVLGWQERIQGKVKSIETEDIDQDDTSEVFIGTSAWYYEYIDSIFASWWERYYFGALYYVQPKVNGSEAVLRCLDTSLAYQKLMACDINQDSFNEIVCGGVYASESGCDLHPGPEWVWGGRRGEIKLIDKNGSLSKLSTLYHGGSEWWQLPSLRSVAVGDCDSDDDLEIVSYADFGPVFFVDPYGPSPPVYLLSIVDPSSGIVQDSTFSVEAVAAPALFDVNGQPPDEILVNYRIGDSWPRYQGMIVAIDGTSLDTVAISDTLPLISFFVFGDVNGDAMPEVCISDGDSLFLYSTPVTSVGQANEENLDSKFIVNQNYPNPFNPQTTISYYLPKRSNVDLCIYNIIGQKVKTLLDGFQTAGFQSVTWDGTNRNGEQVASGIYFYRVKTDYSEETKKMVLLR
jgi:hypothetical protein